MQMYTQGVCLCVCMSICRCFLRHNQFSAVFQPSRWCNVRVQPTTATSLGPGLKSCRSTLACLAVCFFLLIFSMVFSTYKHRLFFFRVSYKEPCATSCENLAHFKMHPKKTNWVHIPTISRRPDQNISKYPAKIPRDTAALLLFPEVVSISALWSRSSPQPKRTVQTGGFRSLWVSQI